MGIFKKIGKVFKKIGKGVKKVFKKFGKFMGKIGIVGQIAMMFVLPGIGAALSRGFGALWTGVVGQTAAGATASAAGATAGAAASTAATTAGQTAAQAAAAGATEAAAVTASTAASIQAGTTAITSTATGMLGSSSAVVRGAGMVLEKGAQFARTIQAGYKTVSQAVTGAFEETGKWIGGKLGMKTAEGAAMKGSWANYSQAVTDSFATLKDNATDFWSPIKAGPSLDVGLSDAVSSTGTSAAGEIANTSSNIASATGSELDVSGDVGTGAAVSETDKSLLGKTGSYFKENVMGGRTFSESIAAVPGEIAGDIAQAPVRILKDEANDMIFGQEKLPIQEEAPSLFGNYVPEFSGNAGALANTMGTPSDFGTFLASGQQIVPVNEAGYYGGQSRNTYYERMESFTNNPNTGVMA
jgi:hypothetical protein